MTRTAPTALFRPEDCEFEFSEQWSEDPDTITYTKFTARHPAAGTRTPDISDEDDNSHFDDANMAPPARANQTISQAGAAGTMLFVRILRSAFTDGFHTFMDKHHHDLTNLSLALFDDDGFLRPGVLDGASRRGTGAWGNEVNEGEIVFILEMDVKVEFQSKGLGTAMLDELLASDYVQVIDNVMCWPCPVGNGVIGISQSQFATLKNRLISFFRESTLV
ncbi:hypothetical protein DXG01_013781 [Tephrocybe rancida]|nr:hypothetical protein DXG01_013781 [Tephrocybe rancida]